MPKHILITGANGQLGQALQALVAQEDHTLLDTQFYFTDKDTLDIRNQSLVEDYVKLHSIDTIINCAAYTAVDMAEEEEELANSINVTAVKVLAEVALAQQIVLVHISSDYVYDGTKQTPYTEADETHPQSVYASSKLEGENTMRSINPHGGIILRTSWVYSVSGNNFVDTMLRLGKEKKSISVVCDQIGTPTYAKDLAQVILQIINHTASPDSATGVVTYNYSNEGSCSWYDFAQAIFALSEIKCKVNPIPTIEYPRPAKRPYYSVLDKSKIKKAYHIEIPYWRDSLQEALLVMDTKPDKKYQIGIIGSGFIASGLSKLLTQHESYDISAILTRSDLEKRKDFTQNKLLTNDLEDLIAHSDLIVECSGDAIYATQTIDRIVKASIPVVTMNSEFHVTTGSYFVNKGLVTEAEGDQPGVQAILHEEALAMGFKPLVYANIKGFLNESPTIEDMTYWGDKSNLSLEMVTSFTDGTKVSIEQVLVANGLGAGLIQEGLVKLSCDDMLEGGSVLADKAKALGYPVSDYLLSATLPAGVFLIVEHDEEQQDALRYYKLGQGPYYVLERTYHLCHLEIIKTIKRVLSGGGVLLDNSANPRFSVAGLAKRDLKVGEIITKGIGSFTVRGTAIEIANDLDHVPIGLLADAKLIRAVKEGERIHFDDVVLPQSLALDVWTEMMSKHS
ncbi:MAG: dTDP-4-dehydrorhamnose reductase [Sulfurovum sp.]|nr:dTDP-4-dehydrorhamnose reductase [Sulfurovum sp.]